MLPSAAIADIRALEQLSYQLLVTFKAVENGRNIAGEVHIVEELHQTRSILDSFKSQMRKPSPDLPEKLLAQSDCLGQELDRIKAVLRDLEAICADCIAISDSGSSSKGSRGCCRVRLANGVYRKNFEDIRELGQRLHKSIVSLRSVGVTSFEQPYAENLTGNIGSAEPTSKTNARFATPVEIHQQRQFKHNFSGRRHPYTKEDNERSTPCSYPPNPADEIVELESEIPLPHPNGLHMAATPLLEPDLSDVESESSGTVFSMDSTAADASAVDEDEPSSATALDQLDDHGPDNTSSMLQDLGSDFSRLYPQYPILEEFQDVLREVNIDSRRLIPFFRSCLEQVQARAGAARHLPPGPEKRNLSKPAPLSTSQRNQLESKIGEFLQLEGNHGRVVVGDAAVSKDTSSQEARLLTDLTNLLRETAPSKEDLKKIVDSEIGRRRRRVPRATTQSSVPLPTPVPLPTSVPFPTSVPLPTPAPHDSSGTLPSPVPINKSRREYLIKELEEKDISPNQSWEDPVSQEEDDNPCSRLEDAIAGRDFDAVDALVMWGADLETAIRGRTPLQYALHSGVEQRMVRFLIWRGAAIHLGGPGAPIPLYRMEENNDLAAILLYAVELCIARGNTHQITGYHLPWNMHCKPKPLEEVALSGLGEAIVHAVRLTVIHRREHCAILRVSEKRGRLFSALLHVGKSVRDDGSIDEAYLEKLYLEIRDEEGDMDTDYSSSIDDEEEDVFEDMEFRYGEVDFESD